MFNMKMGKLWAMAAALALTLGACWGDGVQVFRNDWETEWGDEYDSLAEAWEAIPNWYRGEQCVVIRLESNQGLSETLNSENFTANVTIDLNGYVIYNEEPDDFTDPFFALHHSSDYTFTIKDGSAGGEDKYFVKKTRAPWEWDEYGSGGESFRGGVITGARGAAVSVNNGSTCTIRNVNFIGNSCGKSDGRGDGGAIKVNHGAYLNLYDVKFYGNTCSGRGGALGVYTDDGNADNRVHAMIQGCTFKNNYAAEEGGAIMAGCSVGIKSTVVQDNLAGLNAGGVCVLRSFGTVFNSDGCSSDPGGEDISVKKQSLHAARLQDAGFWGDISTDDLSGQEADEPMLIVFERVIITGNFAEKLYDYARETTCQDASGENYPSDVYLFRASQDESLSRRYVGAIKVWQGTEPTFRIGVRLSRILYDGDDLDSSLDRDLFTVDHPDHGSYLDGEEKCFFANQSCNPNAAGYDERYRVVYVPENGHRYRLVCGDTVGTDVYFYADENGNGTLYGEGATWGTNNWPTATQHPLEAHRHLIKTLTIEDGVTRLGCGSFRGFESLESVVASPDFVGLGDCAFYQCPSLKTLTFKTTQELSEGDYAYPLHVATGVYFKDGFPANYPVVKVSSASGSNGLLVGKAAAGDADWTPLAGKTAAERKAYHYVKLDLAANVSAQATPASTTWGARVSSRSRGRTARAIRRRPSPPPPTTRSSSARRACTRRSILRRSSRRRGRRCSRTPSGRGPRTRTAGTT